jgi:methylated-DNA-[protein]-cysteine S-methyltransferase
MIFYTQWMGVIAPMLALSDGEAITGLYFVGQKHQPVVSPDWQCGDERPLFSKLRQQVHEYGAGQRTDFELPLRPEGTEFQLQVWRELQQLPYGKTCSYGELAKKMGRRSAVRAVAAAVGRNPLLLLVPCHRVIGAKGALTGYAAGVDIKQQLLNLETDPLAGH